MTLGRRHAGLWHIDPHRVGVLGFSAGGFIAAEISTNFDSHLYAPVDAADKESARPDFATPIYPGHLSRDDGKLNPSVPVSSRTPPTFPVQAEDEYVDGVNQSLVYYTALAQARVPAEMHLYAHGGMHSAFGQRRIRSRAGLALPKIGCGPSASSAIEMTPQIALIGNDCRLAFKTKSILRLQRSIRSPAPAEDQSA